MMPSNIVLCIGIYLTAINFAAIAATLYDKHAAKSGAWRVKERTLLLLSAIGGSVVMLITMRLIRHKTKHIKFMLGIPLIIALQIAAALFILWRLTIG